MPYVEGFGTYPFGEEWLFDAVLRSYLPVLEVADAADDDGHAGARRPARGDGVARSGCAPSCASSGSARAEPTPRSRTASSAPPALAEADRYRRGLERARRSSAATCSRAFREAGGRGPGRADRLERRPTRCCRWSRPTRAPAADRRRRCARTAAASASRPASGCPSAPTSPGSSACWPSAASRYFCIDQSAHASRCAALTPDRDRGRAGRVHDRLGGGRAGCGRSTAIPPIPPTPSSTASRCAASRLWSIGGEPYDPEAAARARPRAGARVRRRGRRAPAGAPRAERGRRRASSSSRSTPSCSATGGGRGRSGSREVVARGRGRRGRAASRWRRRSSAHEPEARGRCARSSWGEGKDLSTWDSPAVADLAWAARRLELRLLRDARDAASHRGAAERAARELLAVQSSDWAFLDQPRPGGRLPFARATDHARGDARGHRLRRAAPTRACATSHPT